MPGLRIPKGSNVSRTQFLDPCQTTAPTKPEPSAPSGMDGFYEDIEAPRVGGLDPDHALLLTSVAPLLLSQNSGVSVLWEALNLRLSWERPR